MSLRSRAIPVSAKRKAPPKRKRIFNRTVIPDGFVLKIDTREQNPLFSNNYDYVEKVYEKLDDGDYSYVGGEDITAIERKCKSDFYTYIFNHNKTVEKLLRLGEKRFAALVIECSEYDLYDVENSFTEYMTIEMIRGFLKSVNVKYNIHIYINNSRESIERWVIDRLVSVYKLEKEKRD